MRPLAHVVSYLTHPLAAPTLLLLLYLALDPYAFGAATLAERLPLIALVASSSFFIPGLVVLMMVGLEVIPSARMPEQRHRTLPLLATGMLTMGVFAYCRQAPEVPALYAGLVLGCVVGTFAAFFANLFTKISLHAVGWGGIAAACLALASALPAAQVSLAGGQLRLGAQVFVVAALLVGGLAGSARLALGAHELRDVLGGYVVGAAAMLAGVAAWVL